jgi:hypothetical protein
MNINPTPNVMVITLWHQMALGVLFLILPMCVTGAFIGIGVYLNLPGWILALGGVVLALVSLVLGGTFGYKRLPKDAMRVERDALVGVRCGTIPFDSITQYNLDDGIKIHRQGHATLKLKSTTERERYNEFHAAFASAITIWQFRHPASKMKPDYFYGSLKARAIGGALLFISVGTAIGALMMDIGGGIGIAMAGAVTGIALMVSKRRDGA